MQSDKLIPFYKPIIILIIYLFIFDIILTSRIIYNFGIEHELNTLIYNSYISPGYLLLYLFLVALSFVLFIITYHYPIKFNFYLFSSFLIIYYLMNASNILTAIKLYTNTNNYYLSSLFLIAFTLKLILIFSISYLITKNEKREEETRTEVRTHA